MALHQQVRGIHIGTSRWDLRLFPLVSFACCWLLLRMISSRNMRREVGLSRSFVTGTEWARGISGVVVSETSGSGLIEWWCKAWVHLVARQCFES